MVNVAVLGYGVVGSGVVEVLKKNGTSIKNRAGKEIHVKKILDIRDFPDSPDSSLLTKDSSEVFDDPSISIIVETIGGAGIAYEFTRRALSNGKHVVTSNKELVAKHGPELLNLAKENDAYYLFEASVGGGIPIVRPLGQCLAANEINGITGILNGTTNYILTQMRKNGKDFSTALLEAQKNGYAEANPTADIEGHDSSRKIAILSSIAYNEYVDSENIPTEGIKYISLIDMDYAESMNSVIKLIASSTKCGDKIYARVAPTLVPKSHPLSNVEDVFNAIFVSGNALGDAMFYGRGAGKLPTASAVVADIIDIVKHTGVNLLCVWNKPDGNNMMDPSSYKDKFFVRIKYSNSSSPLGFIEKTFKELQTVLPHENKVDGEIAFITPIISENDLEGSLSSLKREFSDLEVVNILRILE